MIAIDHYCRKCWAKIVFNRTTETIIDFLEVKLRGIRIEKLVSDNAKEFVSEKFREYNNKKEFNYYKIGIENHQSNRRCKGLLRH